MSLNTRYEWDAKLLDQQAKELDTDTETMLLAGLAVVVHRHVLKENDTLVVGYKNGTGLIAKSFPFWSDSTFRDLLAAAEPARDSCGTVICAEGIEDSRFDPSTRARMRNHLDVVLKAATAEPDIPVTGLDMLSSLELSRMLIDWNATDRAFHSDRGIHEAFEEMTETAPDAVAVIQNDRSFSFAAVNMEANRIAGYLQRHGVQAGSRVGLCLGRTPQLVFAILGVLKAGCAYVPLDPDYPEGRIATMIMGAGCAVTLSQSDTADKLRSADTKILELDSLRSELLAEPVGNLNLEISADDLCYIMYTSGSSGEPKPIALKHQGVLNNMLDLNQRLSVGLADSMLSVSSPSFDMSVYELLGAGLAGARVVMPDSGREHDFMHLVSLVRRHRITMWSSAPAILTALLDELEARDDHDALPLRLAMVAGDWVPLELPDRLKQMTTDTRFLSLGGATEASVYSTIFEVEQVDPQWKSIPYGVPMRNQQTFILDSHGKPAPIGVAGELHLAGIGLAQGYFNQPELTTDRFFTWSYGSLSETRLYKTGDLARFREDGVIELLGRLDQQVKINGLRVELGEIEAALTQNAEVKQAVVMARTLPSGGRQLIGYVVPEPGHDIRTEVLLDRIAGALPRYMIPAGIAIVAKFSLNANGKIDRNALPQIDSSLDYGVEPCDETEGRIAAVFRDLLEVPRIARTDDLIGLGADSITMLKAMSRIHPKLAWSDMFDSSNIVELAQRVRDLDLAD